MVQLIIVTSTIVLDFSKFWQNFKHVQVAVVTKALVWKPIDRRFESCPVQYFFLHFNTLQVRILSRTIHIFQTFHKIAGSNFITISSFLSLRIHFFYYLLNNCFITSKPKVQGLVNIFVIIKGRFSSDTLSIRLSSAFWY